VLDWAADLQLLVDHLGVPRFAVVAISYGGAFAAATAWQLAERVTALGMLSVIGPLDTAATREGMSAAVRRSYTVARRAP